ncbi:efflux RND transporter periplasmic adaptor subunit [Vibrio navarrensis]|uniref:efflux RND transporter periplasmic adaptor subunit n=1 Tax=Vibrio navarrensis TaxID=29495 RepID=UPI001869C176|nr:efflux RND transporter periplasmic adaptor subunit [Vibrio navarrensis]EJL6397365.1 efflux RND transporter periplasmic adaptor subunit [Vibrio navarrensis]EJL6564702.1 efflux RND transporter periplasmic adaptor subunit [Vibrio navarrensis]EKA5634234.1 efflux RND transporter periplasmic adaptor subunit [Vibrio navarrensis]MBE4574187.1 efflux transporter periplasmic adaptor subunit [Vibrio navarrensis]
MSIKQQGRFFLQRPWLVSLLIILALTTWLSVGSLQAEEPAPLSKEQAIPLASVVFQTFNAQNTAKSIDLYGRTAPNRQAKLGAEIAGKIVRLEVEKGQAVRKGQVIAVIDKRDLDSQLQRAKAMLDVRQKEFKAAQSLNNRGLQGEVAFATAEAALVEAKANLVTVETELRNTEVKAPFDGIVDSRFVELGDFVGIGDPVATVIDLDKLLIEADVSERHVQSLANSQTAKVRLLNGLVLDGKIRYVGQVSSPATNTFPIEVEVDNRMQRIPAGVSAEVHLTLDETLAIKVTPAMLALDNNGNLGVKTLQDNVVRFVPIQLVKAEQDGVWLSGLGDKVDIIVLGQGFVRDGDKVHATRQDSVAVN